MTIFLSICLAISIIGMFTSKKVSEFCGPKGKGGPGDVFRTLFSVMWLTIGPLICLIGALFFGLCLALIH